MKNERSASTPPEAPVGPPPRDQQRSADIALVEIAKLQTDGQYIRRDIDDARKDVRDMRDRVKSLEIKVDHLPSKGFIVAVVIAALSVLTGVFAVMPRLQQAVLPSPVQGAQAEPSQLPKSP